MRKYRINLVALLLGLFALNINLNAQIYVNEILASNSELFPDEDGDFNDWIELINTSDSPIDIAGYGLSDDPEDPFKFTLPSINIESGAYYMIFASDKDRTETLGDSLYPHANFKLSADGETLFLSDPDSNLIQQVTFPALGSNESFGWVPGTDGTFHIFTEPTPLSDNNTTGYSGRLAKPGLNIQGGFFSESFIVKLTDESNADITYYTTDGTNPTAGSAVFGTDGVNISKTTVLKIQTIQEGNIPSEIEVETYFFNKNHQLPVVSIVTEPDDFFGQDHGIYVHYEDDIEVPIHIELFEEDGSLGFKSHAGAQVYGSYSQRFDQKSLSVYFRGKYGNSELDYELFEEKNINKFQSFILRNAGNDFGAAHMRDAAMSTIIEDVLDLDYQAYRPAVVYINGEYWGVQNFREKISEHFIASNRDVDPDEIDILEAGEEPAVVHGSIDDWNIFWDALMDANMGNDEDFASVTSHIDLDNFIDYWATEVFYANTDWPAINNKFWKERSPEGKWRWIIFDLDHGFNLYSGDGDYNLDMMEHVLQRDPDQLKYGNPLWATQLFRTLMENDEFEARFVTRISGLMNTVFETNRMISVIDSLSAIIAPEMDAHENRWFGWHPFESQVEDMRSWARTRHSYMFGDLKQWLRLGDLLEVKVDVSNHEQGTVVVNRAEIESYPWTGKYFDDFEIAVSAVPKTGYTFTGWSGASTSADSLIYINAGDSVYASFEPSTGATSSIVINEIMYNPPGEPDTEDWIEFYNSTASAIDMSNWVVKDEDDEHAFIIPEGTQIDAGSFLVVSRNMEAFNATYSGVNPLSGDMDFGLAGGSDQVRLFDDSGTLIDIVSYDDDSPWPSDADGTGSTLELKNPELDNGAPSSWAASETNLGTPGMSNSVLVSREEENPELPSNFSLDQNYPNPFNPSTIISFQVPAAGEVSLKVYDMLGRKVATLVEGVRSSGSHHVKFEASSLASGIYIYQLNSGDQQLTKKMMLIK